MAIRIGHASIDENNKAKNGTAGDQTKKEVCVRTWYSKPWEFVIRAKDSTVAEKMAVTCEAGCANDKIGYDQNQRNTLYTQALKVNMDLSKITTACECDCSSFMSICAIAAGVPASYLYVGNNMATTSTMKARFSNSGMFEILTDSKYLTSDSYLKRGDILVKSGSHTVMALDNGNSSTSSSIISKISNAYGIDVSSYQGVIDWNKVKSAGCEFAILKIIRKDLNPDTQFENNVKGCDNVRMRWDVYNYSYATTVAKAKSDAEKVISILNGRKSIVWLDVEDSCQKNLGHLLIDIINNYKAVIEASGNAFGVYTGLSFYNSYIKPYASKIDCPFWIARYYNGHNQMNFGVTPNSQYKPAISHPLYGWQYTSSGKISGVSGNVDINIRYIDNVSSSNSSSSSASNSSTSTKLCGYVTANHLNIRKYPNSNKDTPIVGILNYGDDVHITAYNNGWFEVDTNEWVSGKYIKGSKVGKVNASSLNFRSTPEILSTNKIKSYPKNTTVEIVGEINDWYITQYGYCSKKYITLI